MPVSRWLRRRLFGIHPAEATFARRGFRDSEARPRLEQVGRAIVQGYHLALDETAPELLALRLTAVPPELRGIAFEGAAMALALLDRLLPWRRDRWRAFAQGPGAPHAELVYLGLGVTLARLRRRVEPVLAPLDPLRRWLVVDGYGFHEGFFRGPRALAAQAFPRWLSGYARRAFDQGLGRSLWFVEGAVVDRIPTVIADFSPARQADLWSGVGNACAYASGAAAAALQELRASAGRYRPQLAQGAAFAALARRRAGNPTADTDLACAALCDMSAEAAAHLAEGAMRELPADGPEPAYDVVRRRIQARFTPLTVTQP